MKILDVSSYQGTVDWQQVKADSRYRIDGVYIKATEGVSVTDSALTTHVQEAKAAGVLFGLYHFAHPDLNSAVDEANHFLKVASQYSPELIPVLDIEVPTTPSGMTQAHLNSWMHWWDEIMTEHYPTYMIYSDRSYFDMYDFSMWTKRPLWIAAYQGTAPSPAPWSSWTMWQYTNSATVNGISGDVDLSDINSLVAIKLKQ